MTQSAKSRVIWFLCLSTAKEEPKNISFSFSSFLENLTNVFKDRLNQIWDKIAQVQHSWFEMNSRLWQCSHFRRRITMGWSFRKITTTNYLGWVYVQSAQWFESCQESYQDECKILQEIHVLPRFVGNYFPCKHAVPVLPRSWQEKQNLVKENKILTRKCKILTRKDKILTRINKILARNTLYYQKSECIKENIRRDFIEKLSEFQ